MKRLLLPAILGLAVASPYSMPLRADAEPTHHSGQIDTNEVWLASGNPHILDDDVWTGDSVTLTVMPGCSLQFAAGVELYTGYATCGSIVAVGTADSMIILTSLADTLPGSWRNVGFFGLTMPTARLSYVTVECGGSSLTYGAVYLDDCSIRMDHCTVRRSARYGVYADGRGHFSDFSDNTVTTSGLYPVRIGAERVRTIGPGNTLTGNLRDGVLVEGEDVKSSGAWLNHGVPYVVDGDVGIADGANHPVITIAAGTTVKMTPNSEFYVGYSAPGGLVADGMEEQIVFTSSLVTPEPGDWRSLSFYGNSIDSQCQLKNCRVEYAGYGGYGDIYIVNCMPTVTGCDIGYSAAWGVYLNGSEYPDPAQLRADNVLHDNDSGDIRVPGAGVGEKSLGPIRSTKPASFLHGVLYVPAEGAWLTATGELLNTAGRKVLDLHPGANSVSGLSPGVYFVRTAQAQAQAQAVRKVVITR